MEAPLKFHNQEFTPEEDVPLKEIQVFVQMDEDEVVKAADGDE
jgi:hypothetical protein